MGRSTFMEGESQEENLHMDHRTVRSQSYGWCAYVKDFSKARVKAEIKFYTLSKGGKGPDTIDCFGLVG